MEGPVYVLVKVHADGYVELLGPPEVRARIVYVPVCQSRLQGQLMEQQLERSLPRPYHFGPGQVRKTAFVRGLGVTYDDYQERLGEVALNQELIRCLNSMATAAGGSTSAPASPTFWNTSTAGPTPNT